MGGVNCVILAAGDGTRMHARSSKVLCEVAEKPMLLWVTDAAAAAGVTDVCCVISNPDVERALAGRHPVFWQTERLGTAHAVKTASVFLESHRGQNTLILFGDAPFMDKDTIAASLEQHLRTGASQTVISAFVEDPHGYGRIVRSTDGTVDAIVEELDCSDEQRKIREINSGAGWYRTDDLIEALGQIKNNNKKGEYYLTDTVAVFRSLAKRVDAFTAASPSVTLGANSPADLLALNDIAVRQIQDRHLAAGVHLISRDGVVIGPDVTIEPGAVIMPSTVIRGHSKIGAFSVIGPNTLLTDSVIGERCEVVSCVFSGCSLEDDCRPAPFTVYP